MKLPHLPTERTTSNTHHPPPPPPPPPFIRISPSWQEQNPRQQRDINSRGTCPLSFPAGTLGETCVTLKDLVLFSTPSHAWLKALWNNRVHFPLSQFGHQKPILRTNQLRGMADAIQLWPRSNDGILLAHSIHRHVNFITVRSNSIACCNLGFVKSRLLWVSTHINETDICFLLINFIGKYCWRLRVPINCMVKGVNLAQRVKQFWTWCHDFYTSYIFTIHIVIDAFITDVNFNRNETNIAVNKFINRNGN